MISNAFNEMKKKVRKVFLQPNICESVPFGVILAIAGGFLDAYTFVGRGGVFANAQTGNIVLLGIYASKKEWNHAVVHIPPILAFMIGVAVAEWIRTQSRLLLLHWIEVVLILEIMVLFIIGFIPSTVPNIIVTVAVSFVASIQAFSFRKLVDSPYATTMSTGNLRTASHAAYIALTTKDHEAAIRAIRFFTVILSFVFGAFLGGLLTLSMGVKSVWCAAIVLVCAYILFNINEKRQVGSGMTV